LKKIGLFTPIEINSIKLPNRIMMSPAFTNSATEYGYVTKNTLNHYRERAFSGIGIIMVEHTGVNSFYLHPGNRLQISNDSYIKGLSNLVKICHKEGCKVGLQLGHSIYAVGLKPENLSLNVCYKIIEDFVAGAKRAKEAGFDVIEIHCAHTYTLADFLSRRTNKRTDQFGGNIYNRMKIILIIIEKIRQLLGPNFPLFVRFSAEEFVLEGNTLSQTRIFAKELEKHGIDCLDVSAGVRFDDGGLKSYSDVRGKPTIEYPDGPNVYLTEDIKRQVNIPVIAVGKLGNPEFASEVIQKGRADMIALARPLFADSDWVDKVKNGRYDLIKECLYCNECLYERWDDEAPIHCMRYTCQNDCPANVDVPVYIDLISQKKYKEAYKVIQLENPFPLICGRVCNAPCEARCNRKKIDDPIAIRQLKRFVSDYILEKEGRLPIPNISNGNNVKVAIIGSGISGLTCAFYLKKKGYEVTIFESQSGIGGMLLNCIPEYRFPKELLKKEIDVLRTMGIRFVTNTLIGKDITLDELKYKGYSAIYIAVGAQNSRHLNVKGEKNKGIIGGINFLKDINFENNVGCIGKNVIVIGGGNVAIDVARSLVRLGRRRLGRRQVNIFCLESRGKMPAQVCEIDDAEKEGVKINNCWGPKEFLGEGGKVSGILFKKCTSLFDNEGKFNPSYDENEIIQVKSDSVVIAIGQSVNNIFNKNVKNKVDTYRNSLLKVTNTLMTSVQGIFAGGDCVSGPDSVVGAIKYGKVAARSIDLYCGGNGQIISKKYFERKISKSIIEEKQKREKITKISMKQRRNSFTEVEIGYSEERAVQEARLCLRCDVLKCSEL